MSILASLARAYERLPDAPPFGYSAQDIGLVIGLHPDGTIATVTPWHDSGGKKQRPKRELVPQPVKRTAGISPNFLWDKTSYVLGVTAAAGKRTADEHAAFKACHEDALVDTDDAGLKALLLFLRQWTPDQFVPPFFTEEMKDQNVIFALESERLAKVWLHDRPAAKALWARAAGAGEKDAQICLVTGERSPIARLHPSIKGVWGGQTAGASIVSFNLDAFTSYGHEQGDNAPVSEAATFAYTTALNRFLERDSGHRLQIGDASTVFWAEADDDDTARTAEELAFAMFSGLEDPAEEAAAEEKAHARRIGHLLERMRRGEQLRDDELKVDLGRGVRFHVLGLAPNAARISVRFYVDNDFAVLAQNYKRYVDDMRIEPPPHDLYPPLWRYLVEMAVLGKRENVPPNLAGEWMRSILTGTAYPLSLLSATLTRIRADGEINALRASILRALLVRNKRKEAPMALDPQNKRKGYLLGRLFALYEQAQIAALGTKVNATIKDKFYASASASPRRVFPALDRGSVNHLSKVGKDRPGQRVNLEKAIGSIMEMMGPADDPFPTSLNAEEQALFGLGYYHQRAEAFRKRETAGTEEAAQ